MTETTNLTLITNDVTHPDILKLKSFYNVYEKYQGQFQPGDIVKRIPGAFVGKFPVENQPCIVLATFDTPIPRTDFIPGSHHCASERSDMILALIDREGDLITFHFDSRFFMPY